MKRRALIAQARAETVLQLRRGENLIVTLAIPLGILVFFAKVDADLDRLRAPRRLPRARACSRSR